MKKSLVSSILALVAALGILTLDPAPVAGQGNPPEGKGGKGKAKVENTGTGSANPALYGPYYSPPVIPGGPVKRLPDGKPDIQGYYATRFNRAVFDIEDQPQSKSKGAIVDPPDGKIPYKPEARAKALDMGKNHMFEEPEAHCFQSGVPHSGYQHFGFQVVQSPGYVVLLYEYAHSYRVIPTDNRPHIPSGIHLFMGDSVGHWEGDTLVIDTTNQNGKTWFDMVGNFTTPNMHVVERLTPVDSNTIKYEATIEDPTVYERPWKIAGEWGRRPDAGYEQMEFACHEGNQDLHHYVESEGGKAKSKTGK
jgi:hypothetical protein